MLRMLIVDDEKKIRESMRGSIAWETLDIEVVGLCKNGLEAYDMILDENPDIVLTDIKMPLLSGLELIQRITQVGHDVEFIILSGYGEFAFTKEAMRYGIKHYLLKPCNEGELIEVVQEAARACYHRRASQSEQQLNLILLQSFHKNAFRNMVTECLSDQPDFPALTEQYEQYINFMQVGYEMVYVQSAWETWLQSMVNAVQGYHQENAPGIPLFCLYVGQMAILVFECYDYDYTRLDDILAELSSGSEEAGRTSFTNLYSLLEELRAYLFPHPAVQYLQDGKRVSIRRQDNTVEAPGLCATGLLRKQEARRTGKEFIDRTILYVEEHLADPELSLKVIAESELYMNVDYLSKQFLKYTGCKFSSYLAQKRIEKAKQLMMTHPDISIQAVAEAVGCGNNPQYFSLLFKKQTGQTATEYIKSIRR